MRIRIAAALCIAAAATAEVLLGTTSSTRAGAATTPAVPVRAVTAPVIDCSAIPAAFVQRDDAPTSITASTLVGAGSTQYCDVKGWIAPQTQFEVRLPTSTWQGRYLQLGCGGNCGVVSLAAPDAGDAPLVNGNTFVLAADNEGHTSTGGTDVWAAGGKDNPLRAQFGYLADHNTALVAKQLIQTYYGTAPAYSYFDGYSDGGRAAVQEAQRYPNDFDGIVAGAPAIPITYAMESFLWAAHQLIDANGNQILDPAAITTLHNAAVAACDGTDGLVDGQLSDPRVCHWNPAAIQCSATLTSNCLTPSQVAAAQAMYQGPRDQQGDYLWPGGEAYGSEPAWPSFAGAGEALGTSFEKYLAFDRDLSASFTWRDFQFDRPTWEAMHDMADVYNANNDNNPDLSAFARSGGKLLAWQSWGDEAGGPNMVLDWYAQVEDRAGGLAATQQFARVFMTPGGSHGATSAGVPYTLPLLANLVTWVETGQAPEEIDATSPTRTYPVYAYPARATYSGTGDPNVAASWTESIPSPLPDDHFAWLGDPRGHGRR